MRLPRSPLLLGIVAVACGADPGAPLERPAAQAGAAWTGESPELGLRVAVEPIPVYPQALEGAGGEEALLRDSLGIAPHRSLLRLHLIGPWGEIAASGSVRAGADLRFQPLGPPPPGLSPRQRSLWLGLGQGGPAALPGTAGYGRRSFLLLGDGPLPQEEVLLWQLDGRELALERQEWTGRERQNFLHPEFPDPQVELSSKADQQ